MNNTPWIINTKDSKEVIYWKRECRTYQTLFFLALMAGFLAGFFSAIMIS